jgi:predicted nicotinamide N-methyase
MRARHTQIQQFSFGDVTFSLRLPGVQWLLEQQQLPDTQPPYWAQVWPAALALCKVIAAQPHWVANKHVLEVGSGLALPSFVAAHVAASMCVTDIDPQAVRLVRQNAKMLAFGHVSAAVLNWHQPKRLPVADVLLVSDVCYYPPDFDALECLFTHYLSAGTTILLSAPHRIAGKAFIQKQLPWCCYQEQIDVVHHHQTVSTGVWILKGA